MQTEALSWLAVQEAQWYYEAWTTKPDLVDLFDEAGFKLIAKGDWPDAKECFFVVREGLGVRNVLNARVGDGWWTNRTNRMKPGRSFLRITIRGWGRWGVLHLPAGTELGRDGEMTPVGREDDILEINQSVRRFFSLRGRRAILADWNRRLGNSFRNSPAWLAEEIGVQVYGLLDSDIDYGLFSGMNISRARRAMGFRHGSDHSPRLYTVSKRAWRR